MNPCAPRWCCALAGLFLATFAVLGLTTPGRIDIIDGQGRYEIARSLYEHGDAVVRDPDLWFPIAPGRDGKPFTSSPLPHSLLAGPALWLADRPGPISEARRHFAFALIAPLAGAALAVAYAVAFRRRGMSPRAALAWAAAGVFCTPVWFYST